MERLDEPGVDPRLVRRSLRDVTVANRLFGGTHAVLAELARVLGEVGPDATLLDVGTGLGDIPRAAAAMARRRGVALRIVGVDYSETLVSASRGETALAVRADARALPFSDGAVDVVTCSQTLHHFADPEAAVVLRELDRVARVRVIVSDLRRSWLAAAGLWIASFPLLFHPVSRHDGVLSVLRGFTAAELARAVRDATGTAPGIARHPGFRLTASWRPRTA